MISGDQDHDLLAGLAKGDVRAFESVYERHAPSVMNVAARITADRSIAAEITQNTFFRLWQRAAEIQLTAGRLRPWLILVARNLALDGVRRSARRATVELGHAGKIAGDDDTAEAAIRAIRAAGMRSALDVLSREQRTVIEMAYYGQLTQEEISSILGVPLGTVKSRLRLAMRHLRRALEGSYSRESR